MKVVLRPLGQGTDLMGVWFQKVNVGVIHIGEGARYRDQSGVSKHH